MDPTSTPAPAPEPAPTRPPPEPTADTETMEAVRPSTPQTRALQLLEQFIDLIGLAGPQAIATTDQFVNKLAQLGIIDTRLEWAPPKRAANTETMQAVRPPTPQAEVQQPVLSQNVPKPNTHTSRTAAARGVPTSRKIGKARHWMEKDNKGIGLRILGAC